MAQDIIADRAQIGRNPTKLFAGIRDAQMAVWVQDANNPANILIGQASADLNGPTANYFKCRGTVEAPADVVDGDHVAGRVGYAYSGGTFFDVGTWYHRVDGAFVSGQRPPSRWELYTSVANTAPALRLVVKNDGKTGVGDFNPGTVDPRALFHVASNTLGQAMITQATADNNAPTLFLAKSRGTLAAPATVANGDDLVNIVAQAYTNAWHTFLGGIAVTVDAAVVAGQNPATKVKIFTNPNNGAVVDRLQVLSGGTVFVGSGTPETTRVFHVRGSSTVSLVKIQNDVTGANGNGLNITGGDNSVTGSDFISFNRPDNTQIGHVTQNAANTVQYATTSDQRLKENIQDFTPADGLALVKALRPRRFNFIGDVTKKTLRGFIAQEVHQVFPEIVSVGGGDPCACDLSEGKGHVPECCHVQPWSLDYAAFTPVLVRAVQELEARLTALERAP